LTDDNSKLVDMDDLDKFEDAFFEREVEDEVEDHENEDDTLEDSEDEDADDQEEDEPEDEDEDLEDEEEEEEKPQPKAKGKKSFKERIDEITREKYELRRELQEMRQKLESRSTEEVKTEEKAAAPSADEAPNPDAKDKDGKPLYELGEFDPKFIRDLTRFSVTQELKQAEEKRQQAERLTQERQYQTELASSWNEKLDKAEEVYPDIRDDIRDLVDVFQDVDQNYGDYLAAALMGLDNGPEVMRYLSQNIGEARRIVSSGPAAATIAIGRLDARLDRTTREEKRNKRVSTATEPPEKRTRGQGGKFAVSGDTDDLDAFEREFFKKRRF
jgi:DNA repair exonuclease SbcCD ATPase subunit